MNMKMIALKRILRAVVAGIGTLGISANACQIAPSRRKLPRATHRKQMLITERVMKEPIDRKFAVAMASVGDLRKTNRSVLIDVSYLFKNIIEEYSMPEFEEWLSARFELISAKDIIGNHKYLYMTAIKLYNRAFLTQDRISIIFRYTSDWREITSLIVSLQWMGGI
jgi:hypothetical protein